MKLSLPSPIRRQARSLPVLTACLFLVVALPVLAESYYLAPGHPDAAALLPPPPAPGSEEEAADLASARAVFKGRTPAERAWAFEDSTVSKQRLAAG